MIKKHYTLSMAFACVMVPIEAVKRTVDDESIPALSEGAQAQESVVPAASIGVTAAEEAEEAQEKELQAQLRQAIETGTDEECAAIIAQLKDPNPLCGYNTDDDYYHTSALMLAVQLNREAVVKTLLAHPAIKLYYMNANEETAFNIAQDLKHYALVDVLEDADDRTSNLIEAATEGDLDDVKESIAQGLGAMVENSMGMSLLMLAAREGHTEIVRYLLPLLSAHDINVFQEGVDNRWYGDMGEQYEEEGETALHSALKKGYQEIVELLLAHPGIDINTRNDNGESVLISAIEGCTDTTRLKRLLHDFDFKRMANKQDYFGINTPLIKAIEGHNVAAVAALLEIPKLKINRADCEGSTALMEAVKKGQKDIVSLLLTHNDIDAHQYDKKNNDAYHYAQENQDESAAHKEILDILQAYLEEKEVMIKPASKRARLEEDADDTQE